MSTHVSCGQANMIQNSLATDIFWSVIDTVQLQRKMRKCGAP